MDLPIRNYGEVPLVLFIEPYCEEYEIPPGGEAIVTLEDGKPHSLDFHPGNRVSLWDEGTKFPNVKVHSTHTSLEPPSAPDGAAP